MSRFWIEKECNNKFIPWKIHLYATTMDEVERFLNMIDSIYESNPSLQSNYKHINEEYLEVLNTHPKQKGKVITIYPNSKNTFFELFRLLEKEIVDNDLDIEYGYILGDEQLGQSGRLYYRYELDTKLYKDIVININDRKDVLLYNKHYDSNRVLSSETSHLANDMTNEDDIVYQFFKNN